MRLLSTTDWTFHTFTEGDKYCILSHRWADDDEQEIHYEDARCGNWKSGSTGYAKISGACKTAQELGYQWIWIDTCCIKRESDAELSEAINSMYRWYADSDECIVYLADVNSFSTADKDHSTFVSPQLMGELRRSSWFGRGWTLQELLAPASVRFYNVNYAFIGTKHSLAEDLAGITGIAACYLTKRDMIHKASVATRMSWASHRKTKRKEDEAYCLLGLLDVHMPLLYGEGERAFFRLQLQVLSHSNDESLFAWLPSSCTADDQLYGLLADSPKDFARSGDFVRVHLAGYAREPCEWTNRGLLIRRRNAFPTTKAIICDTTIALACTRQLDHRGALLCVSLVRDGTSWYRYRCTDFHFHDIVKQTFGGQAGFDLKHMFSQSFYVPQIRRGNSVHDAKIIEAAQTEQRDRQRLLGISAGSFGLAATIAAGLVVGPGVLVVGGVVSGATGYAGYRLFSKAISQTAGAIQKSRDRILSARDREQDS